MKPSDSPYDRGTDGGQVTAAEVDKVFHEKASGAARDRPELKAALDYMRAGDTNRGGVASMRAFYHIARDVIVDAVRLVLDTDAVVAAMRSPRGGSAELIRMARQGRVMLTATVPLAIEYEATCSRPEHVAAAGLSAAELGVFLDAVIGLVHPADVWFLWRPQLRDPGDELVLEAAVNGRADAIVGFNRRDFGSAPTRFGIDFVTPGEALRRLA